MELVDTRALGARAAMREGSSPFIPTNLKTQPPSWVFRLYGTTVLNPCIEKDTKLIVPKRAFSGLIWLWFAKQKLKHTVNAPTNTKT